MTFVSYAQNFEDVLLLRVLRDIPDGFYIDIGAADPIDDSVTHAFHLRGWRGINIEPAPRPFAKLLQQRPDDVNLQVAMGSSAGSCTFFRIDGDGGLSTTDSTIAAAHAANGSEIDTLTVQVETLADICDRYAPAAIHFLKIDVEGAERAVLEGADFTHHRPWIVLLEATFPNSEAPTHENWAPLLLTQGYAEAWFDGLNRFYLADEHIALRPRLAIPPNVFDQFVARKTHDAEAAVAARDEHIASLQAQLVNTRAAMEAELDAERTSAASARARADADLDKLQNRVAELEASLAASQDQTAVLTGDIAAAMQRTAALEREREAMIRSTSWQLTSPLRAVGRRLTRKSNSSPPVRGRPGGGGSSASELSR